MNSLKNGTEELCNCPVCNNKPQVVKISTPWSDYLVCCPICGFSYSKLGIFGDTEQDAINLWNHYVKKYKLETVTLSVKLNPIESKMWKDQKEWYLQQNKQKD